MGFNISEFKEKLGRSFEPNWQDGWFIPHERSEVPVQYVLDGDFAGGRMKPSDPQKPIPVEVYRPPIGPGWWQFNHQLRLSNGKAIGVYKVREAEQDFRFWISEDPETVKLLLTQED
jgi:hypothetical protein